MEVGPPHPHPEESWDIVIKPSRGAFDLRLTAVWRYRDLLMLLVRRDFVSFYKQTILGPLWFFVQPMLTTIIFTFVFGRLAGISTDGLPPALFYLAGITSWNYFAECLNKTSSVFRDSAAIFSKVYFPRLVMPLSIVISCLIRFGIQFLLFLVVMTYYFFKGTPIQPTFAILLFPLLVLLMAGMALGAGMLVSAMTSKYRDLTFLLTFGIQLLMYATTVIYPLSAAPEKFRWLIELNPMTAIIETFRFGFLGKGTFSWALLGYSAASTLMLLFVGTVVFSRVERTFVDTV